MHFSLVYMNYISNALFFPGEIKYDDKLTEEDGVYIQAAILFTSCSGQRRLRVINLGLNTGSSMAEMYRNCKYTLIQNTYRYISESGFTFVPSEQKLVCHNLVLQNNN